VLINHQIETRYDRGQSTLEMSLLLFPFLFLVLAVVEFGWFYLHQHTLQYATREGMRLGLVGTQLQGEKETVLTREESIIHTIKQQASGVIDPQRMHVWMFRVPPTYADPEGWEI